MSKVRLLALALVLSTLAFNAEDPAYEPLTRAFAALNERRYAEAIAAFEQAAKLAPARADIRKNLAYTYLKTGEPVKARDQFAEAMRLDPEDDHSALEYAFLCHETKQQAIARRVFDRIRRKGNAVAEQAFRNIDEELGAGIARWQKAVELAPGQWTAHEELARLAEQRGDLALAASHFATALELRPDRRNLLLDLGRVWRDMGEVEKANAALLAASRGAEPYVAEQARELLPSRYPYVYEFKAALAMDRDNVPLRRELAYLHLAMGSKAEAEAEFRAVVKAEPDDFLSGAQLGFLLIARNEAAEAMPLLERALGSDDDELTDRVREALRLPKALRRRPDASRSQTSNEAKQLAQKSLDAGYLKDALKYLSIAHENDPVDFGVMLRLGWTYNVLHDDKSAVEWFRLARASPDPKVQTEAQRAYSNLKPALARFRTTTWLYPFYSTRWRDLFTYSQVRTELRLPNQPFRLYLSTRFNGDIRQTGTPLSERSAIFGGGVSSRLGKHATAWAEAGVSVAYKTEPDKPRIRSDYRGGLAWTRSFGRNIGAAKAGAFFETGADAVYISRFDNDFLLYGQTKTGWTLGTADSVQLQVYWNANLTADARRFSWANTAETGPGIRWKLPGLNPPVLFSVDALKGRYLVPDGTRAPNYHDLRVGFWYAFSR